MFRRFARLTATAAVALVVAVPASAQTFTGTLTTSSPTFNRPLSFFQGGTCNTSSVGTNVFYSVLTMQVSAAGSYTIALNSTAFDTFGVLYGSVFNPAIPCLGAIAANDDFSGTNSQVTVTLAAGQTYNWVAAAFRNGDGGAFTTTITGPGTASVVPEPSTYALLATGLVGLAAVRRRRRST